MSGVGGGVSRGELSKGEIACYQENYTLNSMIHLGKFHIISSNEKNRMRVKIGFVIFNNYIDELNMLKRGGGGCDCVKTYLFSDFSM